ncbi:uncharacterized protein NECHADRAFT_77710 [Fusarium vanettenii 77-13-4]|uniref:Uncharacterized protein n=1 Tax=Fusarium vanettenii (strain ATCC MYA-4622 / CBS 123669 / FGSC 9596 / NRRL 45880 / 77-13-4) TaxID=660122 RepID=C7YLZ7_FUSV7|nr:uncharacterized protein NECHADRAFT_77710 [Fusarium vanettenii 77-13-4]EEU47363.1 predicted protein [Fusarium vanettenii 77-13-4]
MTDSNLASITNDLNAPDNTNDSNLSESLADMDLDPSSSSEDKRSREESEAAAEETDESSPPTKRQRRGEDSDEEEMDDENISEQQGVIQESEENRGDESQQQRILQDDVDNNEDASQQHETVQDDVEIGSSLENNVDSSHSVDEKPYQPVDANIYSPTASIAEGSMISFEISPGNFDDLPPLVPLDQLQQDAGPVSEVSSGGGDADSSAYSAMLVSFLIQAERNRRINNTRHRRRRGRRPRTPAPEWMTGIPNRPYPRSFITGREYIRRVMSEPYELSDEES